MTTRVYLPKLLHVRRSMKNIGRTRRKKLKAWLDSKVSDFEGTATIQTVSGVTETDPVQATSVLTFSDVPDNNSQVFIGNKLYEWKNNLDEFSLAAQVAIGGSVEAAIAALEAAVNNDSSGNGIQWLNTGVNRDAEVIATTATTLTVGAKASGAAGNGEPTTATDTTNLSWSSATTVGGVDGDVLTITGHGFQTTDGPYYISSDGAIPSGLDGSTYYWVRAIDANTVALYLNSTDADNDEHRVSLVDAGSGTITFSPAVDEQSVGEHMRQGETPGALQDSTDIDDFA